MTWIATKTYGAERGLSCALRQWSAESHCALIHGYSLGFRFTFAAEQLDRRGWVVDFGTGGFGQIRAWLHEAFDHALLVAEDDPALHELLRLPQLGLARVQVVPGTSCELLAQFVWRAADALISSATGGRCWVAEVECMEHGANSATYRHPDSILRGLRTEALTVLLNEPVEPQGVVSRPRD
ncbi:6-carboxytetrahydropterin synthase [Phenylobacterium sp.]|jgi:6-pyruvoyltetrahydropterin/6-carboxytetrahydropterin synthase|uniref:6-pyruvoyl trahydropterin synthase family protein n=1 Tax=Phenylobacterium sp. TaxID=1871053 RepID=UPI000C8A7D60|nr:6-carboxytetrahydropterin synthase [Phenylobacterium sp.]MAK80923.1 6-pyruvoyl tetrahydrobiopterin synthase [Phenylobacterium sp.]|tara:strand:+ start:11909 stop:12454 length:546 start_codon:yes stop_codon:yes gene_type:complete